MFSLLPESLSNYFIKEDALVTNKSNSNIEYPNEIKHEIYSRIKSFFGEEKFDKIDQSFVIVVGIGGVGSHCVNMLVRSGVTKVRLIDFDQVSLSSLNRNSVATMSDVGKPKVEVMKQKLLSIIPWCEIEIINELFNGNKANILLSGNPSYIIDCIDDVNTKSELISYCINHHLPVITCMGAGGKSDPTKLRIAPLSDCINDPLATKIKWKLKKFKINPDDVMSLFSIEKTVSELLPLNEDQYNNPQDYGAVDYMRVRVVPVLGTSPAIFGQALASYVLCQLGETPYEPESCEKLSKNLKHKLKQTFRNDELKRFHTVDNIDIDDDDIDFIVCQVWKSRCAITRRKFGGHSTLVLTRWNPAELPSPYNLVLLMPNEALKLYENNNGNTSHISEEIRQQINERLQWAKQIYVSTFDNMNQEINHYKQSRIISSSSTSSTHNNISDENKINDKTTMIMKNMIIMSLSISVFYSISVFIPKL